MNRTFIDDKAKDDKTPDIPTLNSDHGEELDILS